MATKKVEDKKVKSKKTTSKEIKNNKSKDKEIKDKMTKEVKSDAKKTLKKTDNKVKEVEEEKVVCEECGKKYLASLNECPKCGYSPVEDVKSKTFYDDEEYEDDFEDYDDEDEEEIVPKKESKKKSELVVEDKKIEKNENKNKKKEDTQKDLSKKELNKREKDKIKHVSNRSTLMEQNEEFINFIKILVVIVLLVIVVYLVAAFLNKEFEKEKEDNADEEVTATIQNEKILATSIFDKPDNEYYVLVYDGSDAWADYYSLVYSDYASIENEDKLPLFWVDLSDPFNKSVVAESSDDVNEKAKKYSDLKMESPTLIHIKKGKNVGYYDEDEVVEELSKIIDSLKDEE